MGVGQLSESDAVDALRLPFYSSSHPTGSHGWRNQFDLGNPELKGPILTTTQDSTPELTLLDGQVPNLNQSDVREALNFLGEMEVERLVAQLPQ